MASNTSSTPTTTRTPTQSDAEYEAIRKIIDSDKDNKNKLSEDELKRLTGINDTAIKSEKKEEVKQEITKPVSSFKFWIYVGLVTLGILFLILIIILIYKFFSSSNNKSQPILNEQIIKSQIAPIVPTIPIIKPLINNQQIKIPSQEIIKPPIVPIIKAPINNQQIRIPYQEIIKQPIIPLVSAPIIKPIATSLVYTVPTSGSTPVPTPASISTVATTPASTPASIPVFIPASTPASTPASIPASTTASIPASTSSSTTASTSSPLFLSSSKSSSPSSSFFSSFFSSSKPITTSSSSLSLNDFSSYKGTAKMPYNANLNNNPRENFFSNILKNSSIANRKVPVPPMDNKMSGGYYKKIIKRF